MADRDPAFLWETEALRGATSRSSARGQETEGPSSSDWVTLRQAAEISALPVSTLRNWARKGRVPTTLDQRPEGPRRLVSLEGVRARARHLGHTVKPAEDVAPPVPGTEHAAAAPPGTMLVPIDAWDKMLIQLGNLHQAGQQLAEARERAARAETEASFLRERLAELRQAATAASAPDPVPEEEPPPVAEKSPTMETGPAERVSPATKTRMPSLTAYLWRMAVSERRRRAR